MNEKEKIKAELNEIAPCLPLEAPPTPFSVPDGYFDQLTTTLTKETSKTSLGKVFRFSPHRWKQLAAAAVLTGMLLGSLFVYRQNSTPDINENPEGWVKKEINSVSDEKLNSFVNLTTTFDSLSENSTDIALHQQEIASLTKDISDEEIQSLLNEISQSGSNESANE